MIIGHRPKPDLDVGGHFVLGADVAGDQEVLAGAVVCHRCHQRSHQRASYSRAQKEEAPVPRLRTHRRPLRLQILQGPLLFRLRGLLKITFTKTGTIK